MAAKDTEAAIQNAEEAHKACELLEADLAKLKATFEQYFLGLERKPPDELHRRVKKKMHDLKALKIRQTAVRFRIQGMAAKLLTYERLWDKTILEIENGTYRRDVFKAKFRHKKKDGDASPEVASQKNAAKKKEAAEFDSEEVEELSDFNDIEDIPPPFKDQEEALPTPTGSPASTLLPRVTPKVTPLDFKMPSVEPLPASPPNLKKKVSGPVPQVAPVKPAQVRSEQVSDAQVKAIYDAYVVAKKRCNEDTSKLTLDGVAKSLRQQVPQLMKSHNAKSVDFKVVIKDGKAVLKAVPKG